MTLSPRTASACGTASRVTILCYHRVCPGSRSITPEIFARHLDILASTCDVVTLETAASVQRGTRPASNRPMVSITFDDGWADAFVYAEPLLAQRGLPATLFVSTALMQASVEDAVRCGEMGPPGLELLRTGRSAHFMTWDELDALASRPTFRVEAHGHSHFAYFTGPEVVGVSSTSAVDSIMCWVDEETIKRGAVGAVLYRIGTAYSGPRFLENRTLAAWAEAAWRRTGRYPLAQARLIGACRRLVKMGAFAGTIEPRDSWLSRALEDLEECMGLLRRRLGVSVRYMAWPFGWSSKEIQNAVTALGIAESFGANPPQATPAVRAHEPLPRVLAPSSTEVLRRVVLGRQSERASSAAVAVSAFAPSVVVPRAYCTLLSLLEHLPLAILVPDVPVPASTLGAPPRDSTGGII